VEEKYVKSDAMNKEHINAVISQFSKAAKNAIRAGFDGVEIHGMRLFRLIKYALT
jgi:2,4-dienoyl-CoA reductase-like NADH-dependent reductase (Old Yellow Enzyme family)